MTRFLAAVLSVIAVGVLLIAYGLLSPRAAAFGPAEWQGAPGYQLAVSPGGFQAYAPNGTAQPMLVSGYQLVRAPVAGQQILYDPSGTAVQQPIVVQQAPRPAARRTVARDTGRNWKKTALLVGGSTATGAGVGAIFGGKKGALIGAAIGGGASTLYESTK